MMSPEVKSLWLDALRSGKYKQGNGFLRREDNTFCCLGVLCDIHSSDRWTLCESEVNYRIGKHGSLLPMDVIDWSGISDCYGTIDELKTTLTRLNDNGRTFAEIADIIDLYL